MPPQGYLEEKETRGQTRVPGEIHTRPTTATGTTKNPTWQHAVVSDLLPSAKDHAQHVTLLSRTVKKCGKIVGRPENFQL